MSFDSETNKPTLKQKEFLRRMKSAKEFYRSGLIADIGYAIGTTDELSDAQVNQIGKTRVHKGIIYYSGGESEVHSYGANVLREALRQSIQKKTGKSVMPGSSQSFSSWNKYSCGRLHSKTSDLTILIGRIAIIVGEVAFQNESLAGLIQEAIYYLDCSGEAEYSIALKISSSEHFLARLLVFRRTVQINKEKQHLLNKLVQSNTGRDDRFPCERQDFYFSLDSECLNLCDVELIADINITEEHILHQEQLERKGEATMPICFSLDRMIIDETPGEIVVEVPNSLLVMLLDAYKEWQNDHRHCAQSP